MCTIESLEFGTLEGRTIYLFRLHNRNGICVEIISYGATLKSINVPDKSGKNKNIILGYDTFEDYLSDNSYLGTTIGRYANRISNASFMMDDERYFLDKNDGVNCNHGGFSGFNRKNFAYEIKDGSLTLAAGSRDGESGFPGNIILTVIYRLTHENELLIGYHVSTDKKTPVNITNHAYFNLSGEETILDHLLKIEADRILESNDVFLPTGAALDISDNTAFDFRESKAIAENMQLKDEGIRGYNTYFIGRKNEDDSPLRKLATLKSKKSSRRVEIFSTMPGIMLYTGDYLSGIHKPFSGVSLEAHYYPDSLNHPHFQQKFCTEDTGWNEMIIYRID